MKTALWHGKRSIKEWERERQLDSHQERLRNVRPSTHQWEWEPHILNQNKRFMLEENKFTEIERENRYLLQKITHGINRSTTQKDQDRERMNRSLNARFRRKQLESIEAENARLLKRLNERKSEYETEKLRESWKKQKEVIKNIAHYPFIIRASVRPGRRKAASKAEGDKTRAKSTLDEDIQLVRIRNIDGQNFVVSVHFGKDKMVVAGNHNKQKDKIIQIPKEEAIAFIQHECSGKLQGLFDRLSYDRQQDVLYLIGREAAAGLQTIHQNPWLNEDSKASNY